MTPAAWDAVAHAAKWARGMADVMVDVHWIGGNPARSELYGAAAWGSRAGMIMLRNPGNESLTASFLLGRILELPVGGPSNLTVHVEYASGITNPSMAGRFLLQSTSVCSDVLPCVLETQTRYRLNIAPFEVLMIVATP